MKTLLLPGRPYSAAFLVAAACACAAAAAIQPAVAADPPPPKSEGEATEPSAEPRGGFFRRLFRRSDSEPKISAAQQVTLEQRPAARSQPETEPESKPAPPRHGFLSNLVKSDAAWTAPEDVPLPNANAKDRSQIYAVKSGGVPFYRDGPLQVQPPELILDRGTLVTIVRTRNGWSDIVLESGAFGTVASDLLRKAKASDFPVEELVIEDVGQRSGVASLDDVPLEPVAPPPLPQAPSADAPQEPAGSLIDASLLPPLPH